MITGAIPTDPVPDPYFPDGNNQEANRFIRKLRYIKGRVTYYNNRLESEQSPTVAFYETTNSRLQDLYNKFVEHCEHLVEMDMLPAATESLEVELQELQQRIKSELSRAIAASSAASSLGVRSTPQAVDNALRPSLPKLPVLPMPSFSGQRQSWLSYRKYVTEMIQPRTELSNLSKYQYLENSCSDKAKTIISSSGSDFQTAWTRLCEEYDNDVALKNEIMEQIYDLKPPLKRNSESLSQFVTTVETNLSQLQTLSVNTMAWDPLLSFHLKRQLDIESVTEFEKQRNMNADATTPELLEFLKKRIKLLATTAKASTSKHFNPLASSTPKIDKKAQDGSNKNSKGEKSFQAQVQQCPACPNSHPLFICKEAKKLSAEELLRLVNKSGRCSNCLGPNHMLSQCQSTRLCSHCQQKHHSWLHKAMTGSGANSPPKTTSTSTVTPSPTSFRAPVMASNGNQSPSTSTNSGHETTAVAVGGKRAKGIAVLATAVVWLKNRNGERVPCRAFLDGGSTASFITTQLAAQLRLPRTTVNITVDGINGTETTNRHQISTQLTTRHSAFNMELDFLLTRKIIGELPQQPFQLTDFQFADDELADPAFDTPGKIDLLLGSDVFFAAIDGTKKQLQQNLWAYPSQLGVFIAGRTTPSNQVYTFVAIEALRRQVQRFWEVESLQNGSHFSLEEKAAERHFSEYVKRRPDHHYEVALPLKQNIDQLGETASRAKAFFIASERRLLQHNDKRQHYNEFMAEMMAMGHMVHSTQPGYFMSHHLITRPTSTTTKHRVVFNASFKSSSGLSLNDTLLVGPTIQDDVFTQLVRWRERKVALTADLEKMYRMIYVRAEDQRYQQVWWRSDPKQPLLSYQLTTVTYGTASAPFQATRCLKQLAEDEHDSFSDVTTELLTNFYMDDYTASFNNSNDAARTKERLSQLLALGGFNCRKWNSNDPDFNSTEVDPQHVTVLGVNWDKMDDTINLCFTDIKQHQIVTKCTVLSETAQLFDPLGLAAPVVVLAKLFIQKLWLDNIDWSEELPDQLADTWLDFRDSIIKMAPIPVSRPLIIDDDQPFDLHGFADASTKAYGACIYFVTPGRSILVAAKSRVAPTKTMTIPRLELAAALLLAQLIEKVRKSCRTQPAHIYCWTDSQITFYRIQNVASRYATFVAVRVAEIQELTTPDHWRFIPTEDNPADLVSRGLPVDELRTSTLWWTGPEFLIDSSRAWPERLPTKTSSSDDELKQQVHLALQADIPSGQNLLMDLIERKSSLKSLINMVVYLMRIYLNLRKTKASKYFIRGDINLQERQDALTRIYRGIQMHCYPEEYEILIKRKDLPKSNRLLALNPYADEDGVLRVGGRLGNITAEAQRQVLLPTGHFARLILEDLHRKNLHVGPQSLLAFSRQSYWIIGGRALAKSVVHSCILCFKHRPKLQQQIMADLHPDRARPETAFEVTGIDYAGPFMFKPLVRSRVQCKAYVVLFTCYKFRSTHLEVVHDLTTTSFLNALRRFVARRGIPRKIYSDNATNLTGGRNELKELRDVLLSETTSKAVMEYCNENRIQWINIPARSPHFGGLWESMVKQFKHHFYRALSSTYLLIDELQTLVAEVEAILNSRPLTPLSTSPEDFKALTPGHFMILKPVNLLPEPSWTSSNIKRLQSWQLIQFTVCHLADQFKRLYFNELQRREKWRSPKTNVSVGQLVLLQDDCLPPTKWKLGRITETQLGKDGMVRSAIIKTSTGVFTRAIHKLAPLPLD